MVRKKMNKRGIMEDWMDFVFTLTAAIILFFLIQGILISGVNEKNEFTVQRTAESVRTRRA